MTAETAFERLGGEAALRRIIGVFVERVTDDVMIGFFFRGVDRRRLADKEFEFAARHLGAPTQYTGKPLREAHAPHRIMGGQFDRRLVILQRVLEELDVPADVRETWLEHNRRLRPVITRDSSGECRPVTDAAGESSDERSS